jgi:hypothetical protein
MKTCAFLLVIALTSAYVMRVDLVGGAALSEGL